MSDTPARLAAVNERIAQAASRAGRDAKDIQLVAVSKNFTPDAVREVSDAGQILFGENRVQEAEAKIPMLPATLRWHLLGHLQRNKVRRALPLFELIHSVDSLDAARAVDRIGAELGMFPRVLLEVNVAGEASKFGFSRERLEAEMNAILGLERLQVEGLMTIAPYADEAEASRPHFRALREFRDRLSDEFRVPLTTLSMGMSGDFEVAIEEGATIVRVGTAIFGERRR